MADIFSMHWCRKIIDEHPQWLPFLEKIEMIEIGVENNSNSAFDYSKGLIESVCKTILKDDGIAYEENIELPKLFKITIDHLMRQVSLKTLDEDEKLALKNIIGSLNNSVSYIAYLRNKLGNVSHGQDAYIENVSILGSQFVLKITDAIVGFLLEAHLENFSILKRAKHNYFDNTEFNEWYDGLEGELLIGGTVYSASEALFHLDYEKYKEELLNYHNDNESI